MLIALPKHRGRDSHRWTQGGKWCHGVGAGVGWHSSLRPGPQDLIGHCFNCLRLNHIMARCPNTRCCMCCHREGHQASIYKHPQSSEVVGPPPWVPWPSTVVVIHPRSGNVALEEPLSHHVSLSTPLGSVAGSTTKRSPSLHACPSPLSPLPPSPSRVLRHRPRFELQVIPRTTAMDMAEAELENALVAVEGSTRPPVSPA
jgi:hypothetical protein